MIFARISLQEVHGSYGIVNLRTQYCTEAEFLRCFRNAWFVWQCLKTHCVMQRFFHNTTKELLTLACWVNNVKSQKISIEPIMSTPTPSISGFPWSFQSKTNMDKQPICYWVFCFTLPKKYISESLEISQMLLKLCFKVSFRSIFCIFSVTSFSSTFFIKFLELTFLPIPLSITP